MSLNQVFASSPEGPFLEGLFSALNSSGVRYAVMRNYKSLPYSANGSDLDILVVPGDEGKAYSLVMKLIREYWGVAIGISKGVGFVKICALGRSVDHVQGWWGLCIDVNSGLCFHGLHQWDCTIPLLIRSHRDINVLEGGVAGVCGVLKEVLNNLRCPGRYVLAARGAVTKEWIEIRKALSPMGERSLSQLRRIVLAEQDHPRDVECRRVRSAFIVHSILSRPLASLRGACAYEWSKIARYLRPGGMIVAMLGVDGAGKSTLIGAIKPILDAATHNAAVTYHLRPGLLPPLARLKGVGDLPVGAVIDPHGSKPSGVFGSLFRLAYLTLDYVAGYWLKTRVQIARQPTVIIFDRYAYDMLLDPRRFRIGISARIAGWFAAMAPRPDMIFCLLGEPEVIAARKGELPVEETRRQVATIRAFAKQNPRAVIISVESSIEDARDQVLQAMCDFLQTKTANRR